MKHPGRTLLIDGRQVEQASNVELMVGTVMKHDANPLFGEDKPWEPLFDNLYANIIYDAEQDLYRCWYNPFIVDPLVSATSREKRGEVEFRPYDREFGICYAFSKDGLEWTKPELDLVEFEGSKANNIVLRGVHGAGIIDDPRGLLPERRYKMIYGGNWIKKWQPGLAVRFSEDGLHWSDPVSCPEADAAADTHNNALWAPELNTYVGITRMHSGEAGQRTVGRTESSDFVHWSKAVEVLSGEPENQTYAMPIFRYAGVYLGLLMIIRQSEGRVRCELAWSSDTIRWERINPGTPFIPNSLTPGDYDWGCVYAAFAPIVSEERIRIYYGGSNGTHGDWRDGSFCLATLRPDGWAGYVPVGAEQVGTVVTTARACRPKLHITADAAGGSVEVAVIDHSDNVLVADQPISGEVTDAPVVFETPDALARLADQLVRIRFTLRNAKLYSFVFSD